MSNLLEGDLGLSIKAKIWNQVCLTLKPEFSYFILPGWVPSLSPHKSTCRLVLATMPIRELPHFQACPSHWRCHSTCCIRLGFARASEWWEIPHLPSPLFCILTILPYTDIFKSCYVTLFLFPNVFLWLWCPNVASPLQESGGQHRRNAEYPAQSMIGALFWNIQPSQTFYRSTFQSNMGIQNVLFCHGPNREATEQELSSMSLSDQQGGWQSCPTGRWCSVPANAVT